MSVIALTPSYQNTCRALHLRSITYLRALLVTFVGFTQALSGLPAASGWVKGSHHLTGSITKSPLYAVRIIQLLNLEKQTWKGMECHSWSAIATKNPYAWAWLIWSHICVCARQRILISEEVIVTAVSNIFRLLTATCWTGGTLKMGGNQD